MVDGPEKVTGRAKYTADILDQPALEAAIFRSPYAHAEILRVDVSEALKVPGVHAIVTGDDCDMTYGVLPIAYTEYPLARGRTRYKGEPIAAVAADTIHAAKEAIAKIKLKVKELPAYFTAKASKAPGAVQLLEQRPGNIERDVFFDLGEVDKGFAEFDAVIEHNFHAAEVCQAQTEMHAALADYDALRDRLTVWCSTQVPFYVHLMLSRTLKMDKSRIRVVKPFIGGGFGCRTETLQPELICGMLALRSQAARAPRRQPRGDVHHPSRPARKRHAHEDGHDQGRPHHGRRARAGPARRRLFELRHRHDPLCRLDDVRHLRPAARALHRPPRAHQHAALRRLPRPRHGQHALRVRVAARHAGREARPRSVRGPAQESR